jgi:pimeloyl-ACP methyl ester carboxylesterase
MKLKKILTYFLAGVVFLFVSSIVVYEVFPGVICKAYKYRSFSKTKLEVKEIKIGDKTFCYAEKGSGKTLFFIHGFQSDMAFWSHYISFFPNNHIVLLDLPSHGKSSCDLNQKFDLQSLAESLNDFVNAKKFDKFSLIGTSLGAGVITEYSAKYPEKVTKMVLLNPIGIRPDAKEYDEVISRNEKMFFPSTIQELDELYVYLTGRPFSMGYPIKKYILSCMLEKRAVYQKIYSDLVKSRGVQNVLPSIKAPTLLLFAKHDKITRLKDVEQYVKKMPHCQAIMIDGFHILSGKSLESAGLEMQFFLN